MGGDTMDVMERFIESVSAGNTNRPVLADARWGSLSRNGLSGLTKDYELVEAAIKECDRRKEGLFEQQNNRLHSTLQPLNYLPAFINEYTDRGLLPTIIRESYHCYMELLFKVRQKKFDAFHDKWETSEACLLLKHHTEKLESICTAVDSKRMLLFQNYIYLRNAKAKKFMSDELTEKIMTSLKLSFQQELDTLKLMKTSSTKKDTTTSANSEEALKRCNHCRHRETHETLKAEHNKSVCPLKKFPAAWSKQAAKKVLYTYQKENPDKKDYATIAQEVSDDWK